MEINDTKFLITVYTGKKIVIDGVEYREVLNKYNFLSIKSARKKYEKLKKTYPNYEIILKERYKNKWVTIK